MCISLVLTDRAHVQIALPQQLQMCCLGKAKPPSILPSLSLNAVIAQQRLQGLLDTMRQTLMVCRLQFLIVLMDGMPCLDCVRGGPLPCQACTAGCPAALLHPCW